MIKTVHQFKMLCDQYTARVTPPRIAAFEIIRKEKQPITAYELLAKMALYLPNPKPPTAYRALEFLEEMGIINRIDSLNAYMLRKRRESTVVVYAICVECGFVEEVGATYADAYNWNATHHNEWLMLDSKVETRGICRKCEDKILKEKDRGIRKQRIKV